MSLYAKEKEILVETAKTLVTKGYLLATGGNLSLKTDDEKSFVITPSNFDYLKMTIDDICVLDLNMNKIEGEKKPSIESSIHCLVYNNRKDVKAIIHTHQVYASTLAIIDMPIPALFDEQVRFLGKSIQIIPYAPSGTVFLQKNLLKFLKNNHNAYILKNHGVICFGDSIDRAIDNIELVEKCALTYLLALCTEKKVTKIPAIVKEVAFHKLREDQKKFGINKNR
jgi:ribulose-5-phosphate 4-epimerase/fuculose-1-phosphate aldolase